MTNIVATAVVGDDVVVLENRFGNGRLLRLDLDNGVFSTITRTGTPGGDGGPASLGRLTPGVSDVAADDDGNIYVLEPGPNNGARVRRISAAGILDTVAGGGVDPADTGDGDGGLATAGFFLGAGGVSVADDGAVLVPTNISNGTPRVRRAKDGALSSLSLPLSNVVIGGRSRAAPGTGLGLGTIAGRAVDLGSGVVASAAAASSSASTNSCCATTATAAASPMSA